MGDSKMDDNIKLQLRSIYDPKMRELFGSDCESCFDAVYFSGSLNLMKDPAAALRCAAQMLSPDGLVYVTQTFHNKPAPTSEWFRSILKNTTQIDWGRVTYHADLQELTKKAGLEIVEDVPISGSLKDKPDTRKQTARLVVCRPAVSKIVGGGGG